MRNSMIEFPFMEQLVVMVNPLSYFLFKPVINSHYLLQETHSCIGFLPSLREARCGSMVEH